MLHGCQEIQLVSFFKVFDRSVSLNAERSRTQIRFECQIVGVSVQYGGKGQFVLFQQLFRKLLDSDIFQKQRRVVRFDIDGQIFQQRVFPGLFQRSRQFDVRAPHILRRNVFQSYDTVLCDKRNFGIPRGYAAELQRIRRQIDRRVRITRKAPIIGQRRRFFDKALRFCIFPAFRESLVFGREIQRRVKIRYRRRDLNGRPRTETNRRRTANILAVQNGIDAFDRQSVFRRFDDGFDRKGLHRARRHAVIEGNTRPPQKRRQAFAFRADGEIQHRLFRQRQHPSARNIYFPRQQRAHGRKTQSFFHGVRLDFQSAYHTVSVFRRVKRQINGNFVSAFRRERPRSRQSLRHRFQIVEEHVARKFRKDKGHIVFFGQQKFRQIRFNGGSVVDGHDRFGVVRIAQNQIQIVDFFLLRLQSAGFFGRKGFDFHRSRGGRLPVFEQKVRQHVFAPRRRIFDFDAAHQRLEQFRRQFLFGKQSEQSLCFPHIERQIARNVALVACAQAVFSRKTEGRFGGGVNDAQRHVRRFAFAEFIRFERKAERRSLGGDIAFEKKRSRRGIRQQLGVHIVPHVDGRVFVMFDVDDGIVHQQAGKSQFRAVLLTVEESGLPVPFAVRQAFQKQLGILQNDFFDVNLTFQCQAFVKLEFGGLRLQNLRESSFAHVAQRNGTDLQRRRRGHEKLRLSLNPQRQSRLFAYLFGHLFDIAVPIVIRRHNVIDNPARDGKNQEYDKQKLFQRTPP